MVLLEQDGILWYFHPLLSSLVLGEKAGPLVIDENGAENPGSLMVDASASVIQTW
jgi:hypothetical protein